MARGPGSHEMEQAQNPMYNIIVNKIPDRFHEYTTLAKIESLRYPSMLQQLQSAYRSFSIFTDKIAYLEKIVHRLGKENPRVIARAEKVAKQVEVVATRLDRIGSRYQSRLNEKVVEYAKGMDEQYDAFYRHMADNLLSNIKEKNVDVPKVPMNPENAVPWSKLFAEGTVPSDGFETCRKIMDEYDRQLNEADKLYEATKDTSLNTKALYALLFQHRVLFTEEACF